MRCVVRIANTKNSKVLDTTHDTRGGVRRRRECESCRQRFSTYERPILATPLIIKQDGTREEFDREKLMRGIRIACAKRPVSAADIERLVGEIESSSATDGTGRGAIPGGRRYGDLRVERARSDRLYSVCHCLSASGRLTGHSLGNRSIIGRIREIYGKIITNYTPCNSYRGFCQPLPSRSRRGRWS